MFASRADRAPRRRTATRLVVVIPAGVDQCRRLVVDQKLVERHSGLRRPHRDPVDPADDLIDPRSATPRTLRIGQRGLSRWAPLGSFRGAVDRPGPEHLAGQAGGQRGERGADQKRDVVAGVERGRWPCPEASRWLVRDAATLARTASPSAPPIMNEVLTMPEASPDSLGSTSLIAASSIGLKAIPAPKPSRIMLGQHVDDEVAVDRRAREQREPDRREQQPDGQRRA